MRVIPLPRVCCLICRVFGGVDVNACFPMRGFGFGFLEEVGASRLVALLPSLVEFDFFEELVAETVAKEAPVLLNFVAGIVLLVFLFLTEFGLEESFRGDEAMADVEDSFLDQRFGGYLTDCRQVTVGFAAGCGACGGGDAAERTRHSRLLGQGREGNLKAVEDEAGTAQVDVIVGDVMHDLSDGSADGIAVFGDGEVVGGDACGPGLWVGDGGAGWCGGSSRTALHEGRGCRTGDRR